MRGGVEAVGCSGTRRKCVPSSAGRGSAGCCRGGVLESVRNGCTKIPALGTFCRVGSYMRTYVHRCRGSSLHHSLVAMASVQAFLESFQVQTESQAPRGESQLFLQSLGSMGSWGPRLDAG